MIKISSLLISLFLISSISNSTTAPTRQVKTIYIKTLGKVDQEKVDFIKKSITSFYGFECRIASQEEASVDILSPSKKRCDAPSILRKFNSNYHVFVLTEKDISHKREANPEYGIIGLGFCPGKVCVVSTHRIRNASKKVFLDRLRKVALHEVGHNLGIPHCTSSKECLMNDARGTSKTIDREKVMICDNCRKKIKH
jgi:archaemetzincin